MKILAFLPVQGMTVIFAMVFALGFPAVLLAAEPADDANPQSAADFGHDRRRLVADNLPLTPSEARQFWPIYEHFMRETTLLVEKRQAIVAELGENFEEMTDAVAMQLTVETVEYQEARLKLLKTFLPRYGKVLPPKKLARYYQIESRIRAAVDYEIARRIPLIK